MPNTPKEKIKFPNEKLEFIPKGLFGVSIKRTADWEDLGFVENGQIHEFCGRDLKVGREDGKLFKFCPRCEIKIDRIK